MYILCTYTAVQWRKRSPRPKAQHISGMHSHPSFLHSTTAQGIIPFTVSLPFLRTNFLLCFVSKHNCAANISDQIRTPSSPRGYFDFIIQFVSCSDLICFPSNCPFIPKPLQHLPSNTSFGWTWVDPSWPDFQPPQSLHIISDLHPRSSAQHAGDVSTEVPPAKPQLSTAHHLEISWLTEHIPSRRHLNLVQD